MKTGSKKMIFADKIGIIIIAIVAVIAIAAGAVALVDNGDKKMEKKSSESAYEKEQKLYIETAKKNVDKKLSELAAEIKTRADLIPNFIEDAKGYDNYSQDTLAAVTNAQTALSSASDMEAKSKTLSELETAIDAWRNAIEEAHPEIKTDEQYTALIDKLEHTKAHVSTLCKDYNAAVNVYNDAIAKLSDYKSAELFPISSEPQITPEVQ